MGKYDELIELIEKSYLSTDDKMLAKTLIDDLIEDSYDRGEFNGGFNSCYSL